MEVIIVLLAIMFVGLIAYISSQAMRH